MLDANVVLGIQMTLNDLIVQAMSYLGWGPIKVYLPNGDVCPSCDSETVYIDDIIRALNLITCTSCGLGMTVDFRYMQDVLKENNKDRDAGIVAKFKRLGWRKVK